MTLYLYVGLILAIIGFLVWFGKKMQDIGERRGYDKANKEWVIKTNTTYNRVTNPADDGINVSNGSVWEGSSTNVNERVEPRKDN